MGNMEVIQTGLPGVYVIKNPVSVDLRGIFTKVYNHDVFKKHNLCTDFKESYYTISKKNVIRGMHFQRPPYDHDKLVYVPKGRIMDVVLDLRRNSGTYGKYVCIELSEENRYSVYVPKGCAHGFRALEDDTIVVYSVSTVYYPEYDSGVRWDSFGMDWGIIDPIVSERDKSFPKFEDLGEIW